ncbi:MAG: squalene--hopene cyclase [Acidimicrobiales bacterium]
MATVSGRGSAEAVGMGEEEVRAALDRAVDWLLRTQDGSGWWKGELETNVTMDAEDLLLRQFLGIREPGRTRQTANWIRSRQRPDGTWATFHGGPGDLSTTVEAYVALRVAGDAADADHMVKAAEFIRDGGGLEQSRVFTRVWLALFGEWPWDALPAMPPEVVLLPRWVPLNIYDFACWARQTVVALTIVASHRPIRELGVDLRELQTSARGDRRPSAAPLPLRRDRGSWMLVLVGVLRRYDRRPLAGMRRRAVARAERWILDRQEADGCWGGIQPPWVYSLMALHLQGYDVDHPVMRAGIACLDEYSITEGDTRRVEACQSPVWDTALAVVALADAGLEDDHPALRRAGEWLAGEQVRVPGDWSVRRPRLTPGGWAFEFHNDCYPDIDDTAEVVLALRRVRFEDPASVRPALHRAREWVLGLQGRDGGWGAFDVDNDRVWCRDLPFCDFGEVIDPPSADVTAHVVEMLAGEPAVDPSVVDRAVEWLLRAQEPDGSWFGRWGVNHVYGTGAAVPALVDAGLSPGHASLRRAVRWLEEHQQPDGGWGEDIRSYADADWRGRGEPTPSQTAWALLALLAAGEYGDTTQAGVAWLVDHQRSDGTWDEPWFTGTGFPSDFSINYHLYRQVFPVMALGRYVRGVS